MFNSERKPAFIQSKPADSGGTRIHAAAAAAAGQVHTQHKRVEQQKLKLPPTPPNRGGSARAVFHTYHGFLWWWCWSRFEKNPLSVGKTAD